ncbi:glycosyl hydrolase [Salegentibacter sp. F188]|uniref:Glycosyl hydrolase n=1 Tax=Autumnicola patrickiae TaxID=3075591 RepID=A0ABU3DZ12_9FLAO|nr:glycosyl hydrolase [Salegentibacter sp. F188]MDT0688915.1 glycosyl hydrolase [Salegentibacter sp. F188]
MYKKTLLFLLLASMIGQEFVAQENSSLDKSNPFPEITNTTKPWTRWWWMGNAVDKENILKNLAKLQKAGIGGVEITPIYGVKGEEENYLDYLSPEYMEVLDYTIRTADSLGMEVDMVLGTGWPYGGPHVSREHAATKLVTRKFDLKKGQRLKEKITVDTSKEKQPANLLYVLAYAENGDFKDLTNKLEKDNFLNWKAKDSNYKIYAVFTGKTGQQVKRAAPGGQGYTLDHYSKKALEAYVEPFDEAFSNSSEKVRAIFNDSYEVYGTDFTAAFFKEFEERRGYDLKPYIPHLLEESSAEEANRVKSDYRETISDLLLEEFNKPWTAWANNHGFKTRLQAHGSPGNLLDMYAAADIPECETFGSMPFDIPGLRREKEDIREGDADPVMLKFSSSAAHIAGKPLTSSESFTWLRDHFKTALSQTKPEAEELFLNGINHMFLHGTTYSPERAGWPGWKFYASVNFSPNNTIWEDAPQLFSYIANCQSMLQSGKPDNENLVYWPIHDEWNKFHDGKLFFQFKIHSLDEWLHGTSFYKVTQEMMNKGFGVDFISDRFIAEATVRDGLIQLPGGDFKSLVIPNSDKMPLETLKKLLELKEQGAKIIFEGLPESVPGMYKYKEQNRELQALLQNSSIQTVELSQLSDELKNSGISPEILVDTGLKYIRREVDAEKIYFVVNHTSEAIKEYIPLQTKAENVIMFDPLTGRHGKAEIKTEGNITKVRVNIASGESFFLKTEENTTVTPWKYYEPVGNPLDITGEWKISFEKGGPELPSDKQINKLESWTELGDDAEAFSGTAVYETQFNKPDFDADSWQLNLGDVRESAQVWINDEYVGTAWSVPFKLIIGNLNKGQNTLKIKVTNLAANRIRAKEQRGEEWKIFHEINMVDKDYQEFDATKWDAMPSGLLGPVTITPLEEK